MKKNELAAIGKAMLDRDFLEMFLSEFGDDHFSIPETREMFRAMSAIYEQGKFPDASEMRRRYPNETTWIQDAIIAGAKTTSIERDMDAMVKTKNRTLFKNMAEGLLNLMNDPYFEPKAAEEVVNMFLPEKYGVMGGKHMVEIAEAVKDASEALEERMKAPGQINGVSLSYKATSGAVQGFPSLDEALYGLRPGDFIMFAAKSGDGKTMMAMNLTRIMAHHNKKRVYYLNTEMDLTQMVNRWASQATMIPYSSIERGEISLSDKERFDTWASDFSNSPLLVSQISNLSPDSVKALTKMAQRKYGQIDCIIVDYVGRMEVENTKNMQEYQIMSYIAKKLKTLAQDFGVPVIALAQLNDEGKLEGAKKMKNECDGLFFLRPKAEKVEGEDGTKTVQYSDVEYFMVKEKVRRGKTGTVRMEFEKKFQFIREV